MFVSALPDGDGNEQFMAYIVCCVFNVAVNKCCIPFPLICETNYGVLESKPNRHKLQATLCPSQCLHRDFLSRSFAHIYFFWPSLKWFFTHEWASLQHLICSAGPLRWHYNCSLSQKHPYSNILLNILLMERGFLCVNKVMLQLHNPLTFHYELNEGRQQCGFHKPVCHYKLNLVLGCKAANKVWLLAFTEELTER